MIIDFKKYLSEAIAETTIIKSDGKSELEKAKGKKEPDGEDKKEVKEPSVSKDDAEKIEKSNPKSKDKDEDDSDDEDKKSKSKEKEEPEEKDDSDEKAKKEPKDKKGDDDSDDEESEDK